MNRPEISRDSFNARSHPSDLTNEAFDDEYFDVEDEGMQIDLRAIWSAIFRNRWLIAAIFILCILAGIAATLLTAPTYRARASIQVDQKAAKVLGTEDEEASQSSADADRFLQTQVDVLHSRALAIRVADDLGLVRKDAFLAAVGAKPPLEATSDTDRRSQVVDALQKGLTVDLPRNSRVLSISFDSRNPATSAAVANAFAGNFIESSLQRRFDQSAYARNFLQNQLNQVKARLEQSEVAMIAYARAAGLIDASAGAAGSGQDAGPRSLTTSNLVQLNQAYANARSVRIQAQQRWEQAEATPLMSLPEVLGSNAIQELTQKRAELQAAYQQERQRHKADYPSVQQASAALTELDRQIGTLARSIRDTIQGAYQVAQRQEQALSTNVSTLKGQTLTEQDRSVRYNILKREADTNRQLYDGLLQRFKEVSAQSGATYNNISIIDRAETPNSPIAPRPSLNLALAVLAGLTLSAVAVLARERFDDAIRSPEDVETKLDVPLLGTVPALSAPETPRDALEDPRSRLSEAHHSIQTSLELASAEGVPKTILLTSSQQGEGKSTTAYATARTFALAGRRILLIDADLRKPSLHRVLDLPNKVGLANLLARQSDSAALIQTTTIPNLSFMASGPLPPSPAQLLEGDRVADLLILLAQDYDHLIVDGPPVMGLADAPRLAALAEGVIFVVEAGRAHRGAAKAAIKRLRRSRALVLGAVLTKFNAKAMGYGDYEAYYGYGYGSSNQEQQ